MENQSEQPPGDPPPIATLAYRAPTDDLPGPTGWEVVQGTVGIAAAVGMGIGSIGFFCAMATREGSDHLLGFAICGAMAFFGTFAGVRSARYYLTGPRRSKAAESDVRKFFR